MLKYCPSCVTQSGIREVISHGIVMHEKIIIINSVFNFFYRFNFIWFSSIQKWIQKNEISTFDPLHPFYSPQRKYFSGIQSTLGNKLAYFKIINLKNILTILIESSPTCSFHLDGSSNPDVSAEEVKNRIQNVLMVHGLIFRSICMRVPLRWRSFYVSRTHYSDTRGPILMKL